MVQGLAACGGKSTDQPSDDSQSGSEAAAVYPAPLARLNTGENYCSPYYDDWSEKTDDELYEEALTEDTTINVYATSSKMMKVEESFEETYPGLDLVVFDLDNDEVLSKAKIEHDTGNITADVLQTKDISNSNVPRGYESGHSLPYFKDICSHIDEENLKYGYLLYASQSWVLQHRQFPMDEPITTGGRSLRRRTTAPRSTCSWGDRSGVRVPVPVCQLHQQRRRDGAVL